VAWTEHVASFGAQSLDPPGDHADRTPPGVEQHLWQHGPHQLTTHRAWVDDGVTRGTPQEIALWAVADVEVTVNGGRVALHVAYPGYGGRAHYVMTRVPDAAQVGALVKRWAVRNRRAAGLP
jgi:hypothetical protein